MLMFKYGKKLGEDWKNYKGNNDWQDNTTPNSVNKNGTGTLNLTFDSQSTERIYIFQVSTEPTLSLIHI